VFKRALATVRQAARDGRSLVAGQLGRRFWIWCALLALLALGLDFVPLFDVLGYDFSFALGLAAAFAGADIGHGAAAAARRRQAAGSTTGPRGPVAVVLAGVAGALAALILPLALSLLNALRVRNCDLGAGFAFFALLPVGSAVYAATGGALAGWWLPRGGRLVAWLLPVLSIAWSVQRLYRYPAVFVFDPFGGYFPGPIYDEAMRPPERLMLFRLVNLVWLGAAVAVSAALAPPRRWDGRRAGVALLALALTIAGAALFADRQELGFHVDHRRVQQVLRRQTGSAHFVMYSDPAGDGTPEDRALVMRDLEFRHQQLRQTLGVEPAGPVHVYVFSSADQKKHLVGAGGTLFAKPWAREVFVHSDRFPVRRLRHELAHVFAGVFGDPVFGIALRWLPYPRLASGLVEGVAEAADFGDPDGRSTVHQEARAMIAAGLAPPLAKVVGAGFTTVAGARAYTMAGSFSHFLLSTRGAPRFRALYRSGGDFTGVYGQSLPELERQWRAFLETQPLDASERARARERFRRGAIFAKVCARDLAARVGDARGRLYNLPDEAVLLWQAICQDDPGEPSYRLDLAEARFTSGDFAGALAEVQAVARDDSLTQPLQARAANIAANVHFHAGRFDQARTELQRAQALATEEGEQRSAYARLRALQDEVSRRTLGRVLFGDSPTRGVDAGLVILLITRFAGAFPGEALGPYLLGRQLVSRDPRLALEPLLAACPAAPAPGTAPGAGALPPLFLIECHRLVGDAAFRAGDLPRSRQALEQVRRLATTEAERLRAGDFLERLDWEAANPATPARR
jgi:tetratricopeptide (TPR) repeat protein